MHEASLPALLSVSVISVLSFVGALVLALGPARLKIILPLLVALAAGALLGDTFLHLLPEAVAEAGGFTPEIAWGTLGGLLGFFVIETLIHWHHHGEDVEAHAEHHVESYAWMNLLGDGLHNFIDGVLIAGTWMISPAAGLATTVAIALHEIPQEFGDFGVLLHAGMPVRRALLFNGLSALAAVLGAALTLLTGGTYHLEGVLVPVAAGGFLYVACADLVPEIHRRVRGRRLFPAALALAVGVALIALLPLLVGDGHGHHGHHDGHDHGPGHDHAHPAGGDGR